MSETVYIDYKVAGVAANAFSVTLASQDGTYGIKNLSTSAIVAASGTVVNNPSTGRYEYSFNPDSTSVYAVSWRVIPSEFDALKYVTQQVGPFSVETGIEAVATFSGTFLQGTIANLFLKITNFDGEPINADTITITIRDDAGNLIINTIPEKFDTGYYCYNWAIALTQAAGSYIVSWSYIADGVSGNEVQSVVVATSSTDPTVKPFYSGQISMIRGVLDYYLAYAQNIPVYFEQAKPSVDKHSYRFTFPNWNQTVGTKIYRNNSLITSNLTIDYFNGSITFDNALLPEDRINADYNFKWFTEKEEIAFLQQGVNVANLYPPVSNYSLYNVPGIYQIIVILKAAIDAIRVLMLSINFQEPAQVFGGLEEAERRFSQLETLKRNYEEELTKYLEQKKYGPYPRTTIISVPEYTLPGGRSRWFRAMFSTNS